MSKQKSKSAPPLSVARAVKDAREKAGLSVRELAKRSDISHTQISRLESGEVTKPSREVLVSLGKGLNRNPIPLLILGGHYSTDEARNALKPMFRDEAELPQEWGDWATWPVETVNQLLRNPATSLKDIKRVAVDVFTVEESDETLWDPTYRLAADRGEGEGQLQEFMGIWRFLDQDLRARWLDYGTRLRNIADFQFRVEMDELDSRAEAQIRAVEQQVMKTYKRVAKTDPELAEGFLEGLSLTFTEDENDD
ncbi:MAG: helix-turn-helix transcriptional regulator [Solirubrobacterales bacterium]